MSIGGQLVTSGPNKTDPNDPWYLAHQSEGWRYANLAGIPAWYLSTEPVTSEQAGIYDSINAYLATNPTSQELAAAMQAYGVTQDMLAAAQDYAFDYRSFAVGTNFVPEDMVAQIHKGERIIPAADNAQLMQSLGDRNRTNDVLVAEVRKLNQEIKALQKTVAEGAVINAQATDRNTAEITKTVKDAGSTASHTEAIRRRTQIV